MGQGGTLVLFNGTPYTLVQTKVHLYQMNHWTFQDTILPRQVANVYVEWDERIGISVEDDAGEVYFALEGTTSTFQIQARARPKFNLQAYFDGIATASNPQGSTVDLGWNWNGATPFILFGSEGNFWSTGTAPNWMQSWLPVIGNKTLRHLCIPGSHDAGMSTVAGHTLFGYSSDTQTQSQNISTQLKLGSRYFDLRPVIAGGKFGVGHYDDNFFGWQGADGENFESIISELNEFTKTNKELIILNLSQDLNTDVGRDYREFNQTEWNSLFVELIGINNLKVVPYPTTVNLADLTLNDFIGGGEAAVVVIVQPSNSSIVLGTSAFYGFYSYSQFNLINEYSNTDSLDTMTKDQLQKLATVRKSPDSDLFLLSWTLTENLGDIVNSLSILSFADKANSALWTDVLGAGVVTSTTFPNVILIDNFDNSSLTALSIYYNTQVIV